MKSNINIFLCVLLLNMLFSSCKEKKEIIAFYHCGEVMFYNQYTTDKMRKDFNRTPIDDTVYIKKKHIEKLVRSLCHTKRISLPDDFIFSPTLYLKTDSVKYFFDDMRNCCLRITDTSHTYLKTDNQILFLAKLLSGYIRYVDNDSINDSWLLKHGYTDVLNAFYASYQTTTDEEEEQECTKILIVED